MTEVGPSPAQLWLFLATVAVGVAIGLPVYKAFLDRLRDHHPAEYHALGSPTIWNRSMKKGLRLQRFMYGRATDLGDGTLDRMTTFLRVFNVVLVTAVLVEIVLWFV